MVTNRDPLNQFALTAEIGVIAEGSPETQTVLINPSSLNTFRATYPVRLISGASPIPLVELATPGGDDIYGIIIQNPKVGSWTAKDTPQVTTYGCVVRFISAAVLNRGARVGLVYDSVHHRYNVTTGTTANEIGILLDQAAIGDNIRVQLTIPCCVATGS